MPAPIFLITPPFTQLNTPYPATAYLKGFLNTKGIPSEQADLGIDVILKIFSRNGLTDLFRQIDMSRDLAPNSLRMIALKEDYLKTIDSVILFLQGHNPTLALQICQEKFLPEASRFAQIAELDYAFGQMGTQDKAKHLATLYLEDLADLIVECVDPAFGFSRYAERLGRSANSFDELYENLLQPPGYIDRILFELLEAKITEINPELMLISVPFPGNLYAAFRSAQWIKAHRPDIFVAMGGGFPNTELRSLSDRRVFEFFDFVTLDDGELPVEELIANIHDSDHGFFKRTFLLDNGEVVFKDNSQRNDYRQSEVGTPDYSGLPLDRYISVIEIVNPMHRMWSDGRWNKLTMAHGCYWGKCTFCDISLDYIKLYEPVAAGILCDRIEQLISQTGQSGFHFVDEAAPPALMRALAIEILRRGITITWWTNIRFEKSFTADLCRLLKASGCIAVSGGLEVASDRLLALIEKGVTVEQVARVTHNFTSSGIMVHAYLMYGFPTQTVQETVDSLEMVRQLFEAGVLQSGFWHQFAMTAHSPVGVYPERFNVMATSEAGTFANNDMTFVDPTNIDHSKFSLGLTKSLYNYMHGICFDYSLQEWFDFRIPKTSIKPDFIIDAIESTDESAKPASRVLWIGTAPIARPYSKIKKGKAFQGTDLEFHTRTEVISVRLSTDDADWLLELLPKIHFNAGKLMTYSQVKHDYEQSGLENFELFWHSRAMDSVRDAGFLVL